MVVLYTTAGEEYDGFSTRTVEEGRYVCKGKTICKVEMEDRDVYWQRERYFSGLHLCVPEDEFGELIGWFVQELDVCSGGLRGDR